MKRLSVEQWQKWMALEDEDMLGGPAPGYPEIQPIVGRDGYYLDGEHVWFEYGGRAFTTNDKTMFLHTLNTLHASEADVRAIYLLKQLAKVPFPLTKEQRELLYYWDHWNYLRHLTRGIRIQLKSVDGF